MSTLKVATAGSGVGRDNHYILPNGASYPTRTFLVEPQSTNLVLQSEDFSTTWSAIGTPTRTGASNTAAGVSLDLIGDDDAAALEGYSQTVTFTSSAVKPVSIYVKKGTATSSVIQLRQTSGTAADRLLGAITWSGTVPVVTMTTGTFLRQTRMADDVYRIIMQSTSVTHTETNVLYVYPATDAALTTSSTGNITAGGVQVENPGSSEPGAPGTSYIKTTTTTITRNQDVVYWADASLTPKALTFYVRLVNNGILPAANRGFGNLFQIGGTDAASTGIYFRIGYGNNSANVTSSYRDGTNANGSGNVSHSSVVIGDIIEYRAVLLSTAQTYIGTSINGAAEVVSTTSAGSAVLVPAFTQARVYPGASLASRNPAQAFTHVVIADGEQTMGTMRTLAGVA